MSVSASYKFVHVSHQKCRLVADLIRNKKALEAETILRFTRKKSAQLVLKTLKSAIANATNNFGFSAEELVIKKIMVEKGPAVKRMRPRAKGRGYVIIKKYSHIFINLDRSGA